MNMKKISIGLLLLMLALVVVPGSMATPSRTGACDGCHDTPAMGGTLSITNLAAPATVAPSQVFNVDVTWTGGDSSGTTTVKWLTVSANNNQFSFNPTQTNNLPSAGTASFAVTAPSVPATYRIGVWTTSGPSLMVTDYKEVTITVSPPSDTTPPVITILGSTPIDVVIGSAYTDAGATALDNVDGDLTSAIMTVNSVNTAVIGSYTVTYNVADAAGNRATEAVRTVNVVAAADNTPPVITMLGSTPIDVVVGSAYTDAGATALDNVDGDLTSAIVTVNSVNTAVIGSYTVTYNVADAAGNRATEAVRTVNVVAAADNTPPVITMLGSTPIDVVVGSAYTDAGATALDNVDGDLTSAIVTVNSVNTAVIGSYTVTYNVADAAGNRATEAVRTVNVVAAADNTPPVITMLGSTPIDVIVGSAYTDAGATALDNVDGDLTSAIMTVNSVNTAVIGSYTVTYNVADAAGNRATEAVRTVNVVAAAADNTPPVITMLGSTPIDVVVGTAYTDAGATALDNVDGDLTSAIMTVNSVNTAVIGSYTVTYNVVDAAGNLATEVVRTVNVVAAQPSTGKFSVTFIVIDSVTGNPIPNAKVALKGKDIKTNNEGIALFTNVAPRTYEYKVEKDGYREIKGKITVVGDTTITLKLFNKRSNDGHGDDRHNDRRDHTKSHHD